jgi:hypothetical protein
MTRGWSPIRRRSPSQVGTTCTPKHTHGALHQIAPGRFADLGALATEFGISESDFLEAARLARDLGFALDPTLDALLGSLL